jgi:3-oxoacyl-(acyl-carrier-protein) synthase
MKNRPVGVIGMGCVCGAGDSVEQIISALYFGKRNPAPPAAFTAKLPEYPPVFEVHRDLTPFGVRESHTRTTLLALTAIREALDQAELGDSILKTLRVGVALGTTVGCTLNSEPFYREYRGGRMPDALPIMKFLQNNPALAVAEIYGFAGPVAAVANACSSGTDAIGLAKDWLNFDLCDVAIAGGADELSRAAYLGFNALQVTSNEPCRPFDLNRKGLNLGEGAGVLILESEASVRRRRSRPFATISGFASSCDAFHPTAPHPEGAGLERAICGALAEAGISVADIAFINAHGTSTIDNDKVEGCVISRLFGNAIPVVSTKAYTGHTLGAAGGIEAVLSVRGLLDQKLPGTAGFETFDPLCKITPVGRLTQISGQCALSTSLAFGGSNSAVVVQLDSL